MTEGMERSPVSFEIGKETTMILESIDEFIAKEVEPLESSLDEMLRNPRIGHADDGQMADEYLDAINSVRSKSANAGFYAMNLPENVGCGNVSTITWFRAMKHVYGKGLGLNQYILAGPDGPKPLLLMADEEQFDEFVKPTIEGKTTTAFAQTEPSAGSDSPNMETRAHKEGDSWVINGTKQWITNGAYADFVQVFARTTPIEEAGRYGGITCFIVKQDEFEVGALNNVPGQIGRQAELIFDDVRVPESRVLGEIDSAFYQAMDFISLGRLELGSQAVGLSDFLLEQAIEYATTREAFGKPIGNFQQISSKIAKGRAKLKAAEVLGLYCAWTLDKGHEGIEETSIFKWFATNTYWEIADAVVQIHGANGLSEENPFMDHLHYARALRIVEGTDELQLNTIAKQNGLLS